MAIILTLAFLPALILMVLVYRQDKIEKEPLGLIISLLILGAVSCFPASVLENIFISLLDNAYLPSSEVYTFIETFLIVAVAEEGCKLVFLKLRTWKNREFNYTFDGMVYAVSVGLGFAALENLMYVMNFGLSVVIVRGLLSVPGHCTFAVLMGLFYSHAKYYAVHGQKVKSRLSMLLAFVIPVVVHGYFDYALSVDSNGVALSFFGFVIVVDVIAFILVRRMSKRDQML